MIALNSEWVPLRLIEYRTCTETKIVFFFNECLNVSQSLLSTSAETHCICVSHQTSVLITFSDRSVVQLETWTAFIPGTCAILKQA